jgi:hypothetical protein
MYGPQASVVREPHLISVRRRVGALVQIGTASVGSRPTGVGSSSGRLRLAMVTR